MAMLHIVNKSPFDRNVLLSCLRLAPDKGAVLLIEDGVIAADKRTRFKDLVQEAQSRLQFYVLMADASARGIDSTALIDGVKPVDYNDFVDLVVEHDNVQSWV